MCFDAAESEFQEALEASEQNGAEGDSPERRETKNVEWRYKFCDQDIEELETNHPITLVCTVPGWSTTWWYGAIPPPFGVAANIRRTRSAITWRTWNGGGERTFRSRIKCGLVLVNDLLRVEQVL